MNVVVNSYKSLISQGKVIYGGAISGLALGFDLEGLVLIVIVFKQFFLEFKEVYPGFKLKHIFANKI